MDFASLERKIQLRSGTYTMVRPGITLRLSFPEAVETLGPSIAQIVESYVDFIKPGVLKSYLAANGSWKPLSKRVWSRDLAELCAPGSDAEFLEYHYEEGENANVGAFGVHFLGFDLKDETVPLQESLLQLNFPIDFLGQRSPDEFVDFVARVAEVRPFGAGTAGYGFQQLFLTFRTEAYDAIAAMALRYHGFDINSDYVCRHSRGRVYNVSWLTLLGKDQVALLGGEAKIRDQLPPGAELRALATGVILRAAERPIVGDVNLGGDDLAPLRAIAALTRPLRITPPTLGPSGQEFAGRWLGRFEQK